MTAQRLEIVKRAVRGGGWLVQVYHPELSNPVRAIHSPPSIFTTKRAAKEFVDFTNALLGGRDARTISDDDKRAILDKCRSLPRLYDIA